MRRFLLGLMACLLVFPVAQAVAETASELSVDTPSRGETSREANFNVDFRVVITPPKDTKKLRVWLPLPPSNSVQQVSDRHLETFPRNVKPSIEVEPMFGNTFAFFEFDSPSGPQLIEHTFKAQVRQVDWDVDYTQVVQPDTWPKSFAPFQRVDPRTKEGEQLTAVLGEIGESTKSSAERLINAMNWVDSHLTYDHAVASLSADPMHALTERRGHCSDYHGLCSTLAQKVGYPSRVLYGLQMFDKASPSHCKMEVFLPPYGWVPFDLSETQKLAIKIAANDSLAADTQKESVDFVRQRTRRGFRENTWLQVTRGANYELMPKASQPVGVVRTVYVEADGVPLSEPDPSNPVKSAGGWATLYRVDGDSAARRFQAIDNK